MPDSMTAPAELVNPRPNAVVRRSSSAGDKEAFGKVSNIEDETDEARHDGWEGGG